MKRVLKKVTAALLAATMVVGLAACGSGNGGSGNKSSKSGKVKIGVSIWSSTDVLGSQCKKMLDAAAKALDVEVQYVDQGHVSEKVTASVEQLAAAGCQGIIICNSSDTEMTSAIKTCNDNKVYLAQFFRVISKEDSADIYKAAKDSAYYIGAVHEDDLQTVQNLLRSFLIKAIVTSVLSAGSREMLHGSEDGKVTKPELKNGTKKTQTTKQKFLSHSTLVQLQKVDQKPLKL